VSNASELLRGETFVHADCPWLGDRFVPFHVAAGKVVVEEQGTVDVDDLTDAFTTFELHAGDATYGGGEASSHGSCGFFFKRRRDRIEWAVMSLESEPFIGAEMSSDTVSFRTQSGDTWVVHEDSPARIRIVRASSGGPPAGTVA
jgi:hypothetical protein